MTKRDAKDRIAWYNGYTKWNTSRIIFEQGIKGYITMLRKARKVWEYADLHLR